MSEIRSQATSDKGRELRERAALSDTIWRTETTDFGGYSARDAHAVADSLWAEGYRKPRVVTTAAELDALPVNSVVVDASGTPRTKRHGDSHMGAGWTNAGRSPLSSRELADGRPMRVLFTPGDAG